MRLVLLVLALCSSALGQRGRNDGIREGEVFRIVPHFANGGALADEALAAAEASWAHAIEAYGVEAPSTHGQPLRIHLYRSRAAFDEACVACEGDTWPRYSGLTSGRWGIALVLCGSGISADAAETVGLTDHDRELIAHEAAHLIGHHLVPGYAHYPAWLAEGIAEMVAVRTFADEGRPSIDSRVAWLQDLAIRDGLPSVAELMDGGFQDLDPHHEYALVGTFHDFLDRHEGPWLRALRARLVEREWDEVRAEWCAGRDLERLGARFEEELAARRPRWAIGAGAFERDGERWRVIAGEDEGAAAWRVDGPVTAPFTLHATVEPEVGAIELRVGRRVVTDAEGWVESYVAVVVEAEQLTVVRRTRREDGESSEVLARAQGPVVGELELHAMATELVVAVDGQERLATRAWIPPGPWGVGAPSGGWGWLGDLRVE